MSVLLCHTNLHPETAKSVAAYAPEAELIDVTGDDTGYWREIRSRWQGKDDLVIIEQDIEIVPGGVEEMLACDRDWCCYAYTIFRTRTRLRYGLGFTKFSAAAQRKVTARRIAEGWALCTQCQGRGCWNHLDGRISEQLRKAGMKPHVHGDVKHLHDYDSEMVAMPVSGIPIERWDPELDGPPAIEVDNSWRADFYAVSPRQALAIAAELERLRSTFHQATEVFHMPPSGFATDKISHGYLPVYTHLAKTLGPHARVCELGVWEGGSLNMWRELFPEATIAGVDNDPQAYWPDGTIKIQMSQDDPALARELDSLEDGWDLIIDDASHDGKLTKAALENLWPVVAPGGYYVIEDWFVGYDCYPDYDDSMLELAKSILDRLDPHYGPDKYTDLESVEYRHGMAILRKRALCHF
jgi:hypothetical protein